MRSFGFIVAVAGLSGCQGVSLGGAGAGGSSSSTVAASGSGGMSASSSSSASNSVASSTGVGGGGPAPGSLDPSYGAAGVRIIAPSPGKPSIATSVAVMSNGDAIIGGFNWNSTDLVMDRITVVRLDPSGTPVAAFGNGGILDTTVRGLYRVRVASNGDGIVLASTLATGTARPVTMKLQGNGKADTFFGMMGTVFGNYMSVGYDAVGLGAGNPVITVGAYYDAADASNHVLVTSHTFDGAANSAFGAAGSYTGATKTVGNAVVRQGDGKLIVAGSKKGMYYDTFLLRLGADGTPDPQFGTTGTTVFSADPADDAASALAVAADGSIIVAGYATPPAAGGASRIMLARFDKKGAIDTTFGAGGVVVSDVKTLNSASAAAIAIDGMGRILVAGRASDTMTERAVVARYLPNGQPDASFGKAGLVTAFGAPVGTREALEGIALQSDGKILVAGYRGEKNAEEIIVARLLP
jgi:uncharacterized delta-60 repeat protein